MAQTGLEYPLQWPIGGAKRFNRSDDGGFPCSTTRGGLDGGSGRRCQ